MDSIAMIFPPALNQMVFVIKNAMVLANFNDNFRNLFLKSQSPYRTLLGSH